MFVQHATIFLIYYDISMIQFWNKKEKKSESIPENAPNFKNNSYLRCGPCHTCINHHFKTNNVYTCKKIIVWSEGKQTEIKQLKEINFPTQTTAAESMVSNAKPQYPLKTFGMQAQLAQHICWAIATRKIKITKKKCIQNLNQAPFDPNKYIL